MKKEYSYHIVTSSPWPFTTSFSLISALLSFTSLLHNKLYSEFILFASLLSLLISLFFWWKDVHIESSYLGDHTEIVQKGLSLGFLLFLFSEIIIFFSLFFAYFYNSLVPSIEGGNLWPPTGILTLDYKAVPLLNTLILLSSGFTITACHNFILNGKSFSLAFFYLFLTILLGLIFSYFQYFEYFSSSFTLSDSIFGSSFFILTGTHALHIFVGSFMLLLSLFRLSFMTSSHHLLFSFSALYWHLIDALWLLLYLFLYCWCA